MFDTIHWTGHSGETYVYYVFPVRSVFGARPGNYILAMETSPGQWDPVFVGQTSDLGRRLDSYENHSCAFAFGATHVHIHGNPAGEDARQREEQDLIAHWKPPCNERSPGEHGRLPA